MSNYLPTMRQKNFSLSNFLLYHLISSHRRLYGLITIWWRKTFWDLITNPIVMNRFASCSNISHRFIITLYSTYKFSCFLGMHIISQMISREYYKHWQLIEIDLHNDQANTLRYISSHWYYRTVSPLHNTRFLISSTICCMIKTH